MRLLLEKKLVSAVLGLLVLMMTPVLGQWRSQLQNGGEVVVDPTSNRATVTRNGVTTPLWDGVHRLHDGSTLTVRSGQVVPNEAILRARQPQQPKMDSDEFLRGAPIIGASPCEQLVERVCGVQGHCEDSDACAPARQLLDMEREERAKSRHPDHMTHSSGQCREAIKDKHFFKACLQQ